MNGVQSRGLPNVNPVLLFGIVIFVLPFLGNVIKWNIPDWFMGLGLFICLVGGILEAFRDTEPKYPGY